MDDIQLEHFISYMEYHSELFQDFIENKNYEKLKEFIIISEILQDFRTHLKGFSAVKLLEAYIVEIKRFAMSFYDLCEQYGYDDDEFLINQYTDIILAL